MKVATKKKERKKNHARCNKMCRPLPPTKMLRCPQCIKAKINSSIKGRSYLKHLFYLFFEISFTLANVSSKNKKNNNKTKNKNKRQKEKRKKEKKK